MYSELPNLIIAGAPKAGTSSVHNWIADHPQAHGSIEKETYYFVDQGTHMYREHANIEHGLERYKQYFVIDDSERPNVILESTPSYMYNHNALKYIPDLPTKPKCLFILREPSEQIYSLYQYFKNNWNWIPQNISFLEYLDSLRNNSADYKGNELADNAIRYAKYIDYLLLWREKLGEERMMVLTFDELKRDEQEFTKNVACWLGLDSGFYDSYGFPRDNETYTAKSNNLQRLNIAMRSRLPKGRMYNWLKSIYRQVNTSKPKGPSGEEKNSIEELKNEFVESNQRLANEFNLDLRGWS
ncbi:MAG: sulfotransferase domain-containing protein [Candidatus Thiodiazotropha sp.]|nr:MAG: hypothetical protein DBO99_15935 [gamma proteobacterium symbiont of Ctena orbiculata]